MSRGLLLSLLVVIGIGGLIYALSRSVGSSGERGLDLVAASLEKSERGIVECERLVAKLDGRFAAPAVLQLHRNVSELGNQLEGLTGRHRALAENPSDGTDARQARRRLREDADTFRENVEDHRAWLQELNEAVDLLSEARAPVEQLLREARDALEERKGSMAPETYSRHVTRLGTWQGKFDTAKFLAESGLEALYNEPGAEAAWAQVQTGANGFQELEEPLRELLRRIREG